MKHPVKAQASAQPRTQAFAAACSRRWATLWRGGALSLILALPAWAAQPLPAAQLPEPLKTWAPWVLSEDAQSGCPARLDQTQQRVCVWHGPMQLKLQGQGGSFELNVQLDHETWLGLPGDEDVWPQDVLVDGHKMAVVARNDRPQLHLAAGSHRIQGAFQWRSLPESLALPEGHGLLSLQVQGQPRPVRLNDDGDLWLSEAEAAGDEQKMELRVSRLVQDGVPLIMSTRLELVVHGQGQELVLPQPWLQGLTPLALQSDLPARLEPDGRLRLQTRAGTWHVELRAKSAAPFDSLKLTQALQADHPEEVWAFAPAPGLRQVNPRGLSAVDPQQTHLPQEWKGYAAYVVQPGDALQLETLRRGDPEPAPDQLNLQRDFWLDFDGRGYSIQDRIQGQLSRHWRLDMDPVQQLTRLSLGGQDQPITTWPAPGRGQVQGVEVRASALDIQAESRIESATRRLPASGWQQDFQKAEGTLHLPQGWRLLAAFGVDKAPSSWLEQWTLLDFFLALMITIGCWRLLGWRWGLLSLLTMVISYQEPGTPRLLWLHLLLVLGLLRVLPAGRLLRWLNRYRWLAVALVAVLLIPLSITQIRQTLYPSLEDVGSARSAGLTMPDLGVRQEAVPAAPAAAPAAEAPATVEEQSADKAKADESGVSAYSRSKVLAKAVPAPQRLQELDPNAMVQTGAGMPQWSAHEHRLFWSGPMPSGQTVYFLLLSPWQTAVLALLRLTLLVLLLLRLLRVGPRAEPGSMAPAMPVAPAAVASSSVLGAALLAGLLGFGGVAVSPSQAWAAEAPATAQAALTPVVPQGWPTPEWLAQLKDKLQPAPACAEHCAELPRLRLDAQGKSLTLRLEVHAQAATAVPLPGGYKGWLAQTVLLDGQAAVLHSEDDGTLWLRVSEGVHEVLMQGELDASRATALSLPMPPRSVQVQVQGWSLSGVHPDGKVDEALQLVPVAPSSQTAGSHAQMPPLVRIERQLNLGLAWEVHTQVVREGSLEAPLVMAIPLLPGERITSADWHAEQGQVQANFAPGSDRVEWDSVLTPMSSLTLQAASAPHLFEQWVVAPGTFWHVGWQGIPVSAWKNSAQQYAPQWQPWPGEKVVLNIARPPTASGQTLTLDRSQLRVKPGPHSSDFSLDLHFISSRSHQHRLPLPAGSELLGVQIDNTPASLRLDRGVLTLPIAPGAHAVHVEWRSPEGVSALLRTPALNLGLANVNQHLSVELPGSRWVLALGGPRLGPAVLFWGVLLVVLVLAAVLARKTRTPLRWWDWMLLGIGLTPVALPVALVVVGWLLLLARREQKLEGLSPVLFNLRQVFLPMYTVLALGCLIYAIGQGLLGTPDMQIAGMDSSEGYLHWYQDRSADALPQAWVLSLPVLGYRLLMLLWSLWLAHAIYRWLLWGWQAYARGGLWRDFPAPVRAKPAAAVTETAPSGETSE